MLTCAYLIKAKAKAADAKSLFCWFSAKSDSRAEREILNILEDNGIDVGRGADYQLPLRTNWLVVDDLPEESTLDAAWCERYELGGEDGLTWHKIVAETSVPTPENTPADNTTENLPDDEVQHDEPEPESLVVDTLEPLATRPFRKQLLAQLLAEDRHVFHVNNATLAKLTTLEMDVDNSWVQNLLLAAENVPEIKKYDMNGIWKVTTAMKKVFPQERRHDLNLFIQFMKLWVNTDHIDRGILTREWASGNRISAVQRTASGASAGGGNATDRNPDLTHTFDSLDIEIALATLPEDFNIYDIPGAPYRAAKNIVHTKASPFAEWSAALRATPGILDYSRAAIFALIRSTSFELATFPDRLRAYINANLTESDHAKPSAETLAAARHKPETSWDAEIEARAAATQAQNQPPEVTKVADGIFSVEGLIASSKLCGDNSEATSNVPMEETGNDETEAGTEVSQGETAVLPGESADAPGTQTIPLNNETGHHIDEQQTGSVFTHLMVDLEAMGSNPEAPLLAIGGVFFNPGNGELGPTFYKVISLESAMASGGTPDAGTIIWWMKQSSEARSAIVNDEAIPLDDALLQFNDFIFENATSGADSVQVWGNGATFDNVLMRRSYERTGIICPWKFFNDRDVRTIVELGKAVGINPRYSIPFEGDLHNALADAVHQAKYVSAIWQRLTTN